MTQQQFEAITAWQQKTFANATATSKLHHLTEELHEVNKALIEGDGIHHEFADCFFLLFGAASAAGMNYNDICKAIDEKFAINQKRNWGKPDENGVIKHVEFSTQL